MCEMSKNYKKSRERLEEMAKKETRKPEKHIHNPKPKDFFGITTYQCGCGIYFTKKQYEKYLKKHPESLLY